MIVNKILKRKNAFFIFSLFIFALIFAFSTKTEAAPGDSFTTIECNYTYTLVTSSATYYNLNNCLGISDQKCASDSNAPLIIREEGNYYTSTPIASQRFYFEYMKVNTLQGTSMYRIKSPMDMGGCFTIDGNIEANDKIRFSTVDYSNPFQQRWLLRKCVNGKYQIVPERNENLAICYSYTDVYLEKSTNPNTYFELNKVIDAPYELETNIQLSDDSYEYNENNTVDRILNPLTTGKGKISSMFSVGINATDKKTYNGVDAYCINPTSSTAFSIIINRTFSNSAYENDENKYGNIGKIVWGLGSDTNTSITAKYNYSNYKVGTGVFLLEESTNNVSFEAYYVNRFTTFEREDIFTIDSSFLSNGTYLRVSYLYQITDGKNNKKYVRETSDSFYVCYEGFGSNDIGVIKIKYDDKTINSNIDDGAKIEAAKIGSTLKDGALVIGGFSIQEVIKGYNVEVYKDGDKIAYTENKRYIADGKYEIKVKSKIGSEKNITIYNIGSSSSSSLNLNNYIFEKYFVEAFRDINDDGDVGFIEGNRILSGNSDYLEAEGIKPPYSWANVPVLLKGCKYRINATDNIPKLSGTIIRTVNSDTEVIKIETSSDITWARLNKSGYYTASFKTMNDTGYILTFNFSWILVDNEVGPVINELLIKNKSQEIYDLKPVYYAVNVECGSYRYEENGELVEKQGILTYAFSTYDKALNFALKSEKKYAIKTDEGYVYSHCNYAWAIDEYDLFTLMYENAKNNVYRSFFSKENGIINKKISVSDPSHNKTDAYQISFNSDSNCIIVTNSIEEREALTDRQPFINNYSFINIEIDSSSVTLINEATNEEYEIEYGTNVGEQLESENASTGKYKVVEYNCHNIENEYYVYYISEQFDSSVIVNAKKNNETIVIDSDKNNTTISANTFTISNVKSDYDDHCLIYIRHDNEYDVYDSSEFDGLIINEKGSYEIKFVDRLGRCILINLEIE